jgi:predicted metal-dependent hydrolase
MSIIVSPDKGVVVRAPNRTTLRLIKKFVGEKSEWIARTLLSFNSLRRIDGISFSNGDKVLFEGREHILVLNPSDRYYVRLVDGSSLEVGVTGDNNPAIIKTLLESWFKIAARKKLTVRFSELLSKYSKYGFSPTGFSVRTMKKRWGSCSSTGKIAISYDLVRLNDVFAEYVIVHELCHLRHHNHSPEYYKFLTELYPQWKEVRNELKKYIR